MSTQFDVHAGQDANRNLETGSLPLAEAGATGSGDAPAFPGDDGGDARASRAREGGGAAVIDLASKVRQRWGSRPPHEADLPAAEQARSRSPVTEDDPSLRCVWRHACEGARHYCGDQWYGYPLYWLIAAPPLAWNAAGWGMRQTGWGMARFYGLATLVLIVFLIHTFAR